MRGGLKTSGVLVALWDIPADKEKNDNGILTTPIRVLPAYQTLP